ncbi:hypothetical protein AB0D91_45145 [Streptomyces canus]|uniref:winged helix-turn-helix transcriptional regulator n=1 Tax=Streptomyces canus TaxID=58343 RepID=UPI0033CA1FBE
MRSSTTACVQLGVEPLPYDLLDLPGRRRRLAGHHFGELQRPWQRVDFDRLGHQPPLRRCLLERRRPCSIALPSRSFGDRWCSLALRSSLHRIKRFDDFHTDLGIADSILSPRQEYVFTEKGLALPWQTAHTSTGSTLWPHGLCSSTTCLLDTIA